MNITDIQNDPVMSKLVDLLNSRPTDHEEARRINWLRERLGLPARAKS